MLYLINLNEMLPDGSIGQAFTNSLHIPIDPTDGDCNDGLCGFLYDGLTSEYRSSEFDFWDIYKEQHLWCEECVTLYLERRIAAYENLKGVIKSIERNGGDWTFLDVDGLNVAREAMYRGFLSIIVDRHNSHNS